MEDIWNFVFFMIGAEPTDTKWTLIFSVLAGGIFSSFDTADDEDIVDGCISALAEPYESSDGS